MSLLELTNIETCYGPIMAIRGISMQIEAQGITVVLGANGAGKTTVLKTICGAMDPQKGKVRFDGKEIQKWDPDRVARLGIGHVPEGREIFPFLSVNENLIMGAYSRTDLHVEEDLDIVYDFFPALKEKHGHQAGYLSGGQQQMLAIARVMMMRPVLMLLDEPSLGLSPRLVSEITQIIKRLVDEQEMTILLVEQNARMALDIGNFGYVLELGHIVMEGTCERLRESTDIQEFYLGMKDEGVRGGRRWKRRKTWR